MLDKPHIERSNTHTASDQQTLKQYTVHKIQRLVRVSGYNHIIQHVLNSV